MCALPPGMMRGSGVGRSNFGNESRFSEDKDRGRGDRDRDRDRRDKRDNRRRSRSSSPASRTRSPKRRVVRPPPRYVVQAPRFVLNVWVQSSTVCFHLVMLLSMAKTLTVYTLIQESASKTFYKLYCDNLY